MSTVCMVNQDGITKSVPYNRFNIWAFLFGPLVTACRGEVGQFFVQLLLSLITLGFYGWCILPVTINSKYVERLQEKGWKLDVNDEKYEDAKKTLSKGFNWAGCCILFIVYLIAIAGNLATVDSSYAGNKYLNDSEAKQLTQQLLDMLSVRSYEGTIVGTPDENTIIINARGETYICHQLPVKYNRVDGQVYVSQTSVQEQVHNHCSWW